MKKTLIGGAVLLLAASLASADISLSSTFGGNEDNIWGNDFMLNLQQQMQANVCSLIILQKKSTAAFVWNLMRISSAEKMLR